MEEEISRMKSFLTDFQQIQSPTSEEIHHRTVNYDVDREDVSGQVIDWVLNYLDNRKCPYSLAMSIAKEIAQQISASFLPSEVDEVEKASNSADLYAEVIGKIPAVCNSFSDQANLESTCSVKYATSVFAIKNKRRKMEDRHVIHHDLNTLLELKDAPYQSYYAVFDGHSGIDAACYASAHLHVNIAKHPEFLIDTPKAIIEGFQITDLNFLNKCNRWNIKSGCTAICAFVRDNKIFLSWVGDSQAVLVKGGVPVTVTNPHKPDREDERQRIEKLGGHISHMGTWRVNGLLAVTRAIGDPDQKPFISSEPELDIINLDGTEDFLILACDGLWDGISPEDATGILYRYVAESSSDEALDAVAAKLVHQSKLQGSEDNITAIVVFLRDIVAIKESAAQFLSNPLHCVQSHDFMAMNGNNALYNIDSGSDIPFSKPTVLELNAASSKKLKNAANVMSSAGFGSASYTYQYVENSADGSFQTVNTSAIDSTQSVYASQVAHTASCFAPEATALSELPTPPIDDMLASQQFENFYSTDLYKDLNNSVQTPQDTELVNVTNINLGSNEPLSPPVDVSSQPVCDTITNVSDQSLLDVQSNPNVNPDVELSPDVAVGIASTVVSTTIETAVKCLSSDAQEFSPVQSPKSGLNPYAKPFVMKSFFNSEESDSMSSSFIVSDEGNAEHKEPHVNLNSPVIPENSGKLSAEISADKCISDSVKDAFISDVIMDQSTVDSSPDNLIQIDQSSSEIASHKTSLETNSVSEEKLPEQLVKETVSENTSEQNVLNNDSIKSSDSYDITHEKISCEKSDVCVSEDFGIDIQEMATSKLNDTTGSLSENFQNLNLESPTMNILPAFNENENVDLSPVSCKSPISPVKKIEVETTSHFETQSNLEKSAVEKNQNLNSISMALTSESTTTVITDFESKYETVEKCITENIDRYDDFKVSESLENVENTPASFVNVPVQQPQSENVEQLVAEHKSENKKESAMPEANQNSDLVNVSKGLTCEILEAEIKSKCEEIQKQIIENVESKENSSLIEPISLINIKDELIPTETEVPSDPSAEDSRVETVAVDLKSLPEGIPEAEGVTEDIDSDSEKDGGWSYMKGNTAAGSKSKTNEKISKTTKQNEVKSNLTSKMKRDVSKPTLDAKNKVKTLPVDKPKSSLLEKAKSASTDKAKSALVDKTKSAPTVDKFKTLASIDKTKKIGVEKKPEIKTRVLKSSTVSSTTKVTTDKSSRGAAMTTVKKETTEISKTTSTATKPARPATLLRTTASATKPATSTTTIDRNIGANKIAKSKVTSTVTETKSNIKTTASSTLSRGQASAPSKTGTLSTRTALIRPTTTVSTKSSTVAKSSLQKPAASGGLESKSKPPPTSLASMKKPISTMVKKADVKEVKDSVNKQILAKKTTTTTRIESNSTLANRRTTAANNKSSAKVSNVAKSQISKKEVPKAPALKSTAKNATSKVPEDACKGKQKIADPISSITDETKDNLIIENDKKNDTNVAQVSEEKFILETSDTEKAKEVGEISNKEEVIVENGSLTSTLPSDEIKLSTECTSENV